MGDGCQAPQPAIRQKSSLPDENRPKPGGEHHKAATDPGQERAVDFIAQESQDSGCHTLLLATETAPEHIAVA
jgi:hypothetical protein